MTEAELLVAHPELHAALVAKGVAAERKRCADHLELAALSPGATKVAHSAIVSGASTMDSHAAYLKTALAGKDIAAAQADSEVAADAVKGAQAPAAEGAKDLGDQVADAFDAARGKTPKS